MPKLQTLKCFPKLTDIDEIFNRISCHNGVVGAMILTSDGIVIKSNLDEMQATLWSTMVIDVMSKARIVVKSIEEGNNLTMLRIRSTEYEVMIATEKDHVFVAIHKQVGENSDIVDTVEA